ncbi:HAMP domain-containing sensor histidine kinase [Oscillatoria sp. CS-180]|uniref:sensor histidine kinase n=1 Tax=Oscillatoria sp. CS-180 TaxID=3021720 RepID=UPI00232C7735|nr:HAMP domain-containing sensor histidine kinase [Oscillatoria sp. CS-180]MDB9525732.1 HAMP domain-containing sensor histidine kinase [Oscillatoria sp. CS-180]
MTDLNEAGSLQKSDTRLQLAYYRALESASFKGGFLARTAHELRSPLNKIISLQQMIIEGLCDDVEEEREFVAEAYAASMKLLEHLDLLIRVSKIEIGRLTPTLQKVDVSQIFNQVKEVTHLQVADRNLRLSVRPPEEPRYVYADPVWLQNILTTLIEMALDSCDRGTLRIRVAADLAPADTCWLWLEDDRPTSCWHEPAILSTPGDFDLDNPLSSSLRMSLVEAMLKAMNGSLSLMTLADADCPNRLQIALPLIKNA